MPSDEGCQGVAKNTAAEEITDEEIVRRINAGDADAFDLLWERYRDWVVRLAVRFTGNRDDALDVLQDTFHYVLRKFPGFELSARMTTFLYPVVRNPSIGMGRKKRPALCGDEVLLQAPDREHRPEDAARVELAAVLSTLSAGHREVVLLRFVDDHSLEEIAAALSIPIGTVKSRLHNALKTLRDDARTRHYFDA